MGNYPTNKNPAYEAVFRDEAKGAGTEVYTETQARALAEVTQALGQQPRHAVTGQFQKKARAE